MKHFSLKEFRPTIFFLIRFVGLYLVGNILYGLYITRYEPRPDPVTHAVTQQCSIILTALGWPTTIEDNLGKPTTRLFYESKVSLDVYEGCNGLNVMIIFVAFLLSFGPLSKPLLWFIPLGLLIIHMMNLTRISLLFFVSEYMPRLHYFTHKYLFTAFLYFVIFMLWVWWLKKFAIRKV